MKLKWLVVLLIPSICSAKSFVNDYFTFSYNGSVNYTFSSSNIINDQHQYQGLLNLSLNTEYGYVSAQISSNEYNHIRRLLLNVPIATFDNNQLSFAVGRLTNSIGLINTNSNNATLNNTVLFPTATYDPRRYENLPDITDGLQLSVNHAGEFQYKITGYYGRQIVDEPIINVALSNSQIIIDSKTKYGLDVNVTYDNLRVHYADTYTEGTIIATVPTFLIKYVNPKISQELRFLGASYTLDNWVIQSELSYRVVTSLPPLYGSYVMLSYNDCDYGVHSGFSYGFVKNTNTDIKDGFIGAHYNITKNLSVNVEQHLMQLNDWRYKLTQSNKSTELLTLMSITYNF